MNNPVEVTMTALATAADTANAPVPFAFESHQIRTDTVDGQPWFVARDVCAALSMDWSGKSLRFIPTAWTRMGKFPIRRKDGSARPVRISLINEPAVYKLAFRSNKPEADRFTNWVASEVIPALRKTGKYEACPTPAPDPSRLTTAKERNTLTTLVNRYVGLLPGDPNQEAYKAAWRKVHEVMGIKAIEELTVEQLPRAVLFMKSLVEAIPAHDSPKPLPPADQPKSSVQAYAWFYPSLPTTPDMWRKLSMRTFRAFDNFGKELDAIKTEAFAPFRENRRSGVATFMDEVMGPHRAAFRIADDEIRTAYRCIYESLDGLVGVWALLKRG